MSLSYSFYTSHEPALIAAFQGSRYAPRVEAVTASDMISTGGEIYASRIKLSFTSKTGPFLRFNMYIPGSSVSELLHCSEEERAAVTAWLSRVEESSLKEAANHKV
jgi:hypothetical protein